MKTAEAHVCFAVKSRFDGIDLIEKVYAHRVVLKAMAPQLAVLCEGYNLSTPVEEETKAICRPSGDQEGCSELKRPLVRKLSSPVNGSIK